MESLNLEEESNEKLQEELKEESKQEIIPHFNEDGEIIGYVSRKDAEKNGLLHKVVHVWILTSKGEFILQRRSNNKANKGRWTASASGHVDAVQNEKTGEYTSESSIEAAIRETKEETGLKLEKEELNLIGSNFLEKRDYPETGKKIRKLTDVFVVYKDIDVEKLKPQEGEVCAFRKCNYLVFESLIDAVKKRHVNNTFISEHFEIYDKLLEIAKERKQQSLEEYSK